MKITKNVARTFTSTIGQLTQLMSLSDPRKRLIVPPKTIMSLVMMQPLVQSTSMLHLDEYARKPTTRQLFKTGRGMVASDSTMQRVIPLLMSHQLKAILRRSAEMGMGDDPKVTVGKNQKRSILILDGTCMGKVWFTVCARVGKRGCYTQSIEPMTGRGHELRHARVLIDEIDDSDMPDLIIGDGLYLSQPLWDEIYRVRGKNILVKYPYEKGDGTPRKHERILFDNAKRRMDNPLIFPVEVSEGYDEKRLCRYTIEQVDSEYGGIPVQVARVTEKYTKRNPDGQETCFWVVSSDRELTGEGIREIAHLRWGIENGVFKQWSQTAGMKRKVSHNADMVYNHLMLVATGCNILWHIREECEDEIRQGMGRQKVTWRSIGEWLIDHLIAVSYQGDSVLG